MALPGVCAGAAVDTTTLVSRAGGSGPVDTDFDWPARAIALSRDGRYALFGGVGRYASDAPHPLTEQLYLRDTVAATTELVSQGVGPVDAGAAAVAVAPAGVMPGQPDDRPHVLVAYLAGDGEARSVWLRDVTAALTTLVSRADGPDGAPLAAGDPPPALDVTAGGPVVAFGVASGGVRLRAVLPGATTTVPHSLAGPVDLRAVEGAPQCNGPGDCLVVAFRTADPAVTGVDPSRPQVVLAGATTVGSTITVPDTLTVVSRPDGSTTALMDEADEPSISDDGSAVAFISPANGGARAWVRRIASAETEPLSPELGITDQVVLSGTGASLRASFRSNDLLLGGGLPAIMRPYLRDVTAHTTERLDRAEGAAGVFGDGLTDAVVVSRDGSTVLLSTTSRNVDGRGPQDHARVLLRHLGDGTLDLVSQPSDGVPFPFGTNDSTVARSGVSSDGRLVAFTSSSDALALDDDDALRNVYVRDLETHETTWVSRAPDGHPFPRDTTAEGISADGRRVVFLQVGRYVAPSRLSVPSSLYVRDLDAGSTVLIATGGLVTGGVRDPSISADGTHVAYIADNGPSTLGSWHVYVHDLTTGQTEVVDSPRDGFLTSQSDTALNRDGTVVAWSSVDETSGDLPAGTHGVYVRDFRTSTTTLVGRDAAGEPLGEARAPTLNAAGDVVAFLTASDVLVRDLATGVVQTAARSDGPDGAPIDGPFGKPALSSSGRRVAFGTAGQQVYVRDRCTAQTFQASRADGPNGAPAAGGNADGVPGVALSADGEHAAFSLKADNLADGLVDARFRAVHERTLPAEGTCPVASPPRPPVMVVPPPIIGQDIAVLSRLRVTPRRFRVPRPHHRATTVEFRMSAAAKVRISIHRVRGRRASWVGGFDIAARKGLTRHAFGGRLRGLALRHGTYRLTARPRGGAPRRATFWVLKPRETGKSAASH